MTTHDRLPVQVDGAFVPVPAPSVVAVDAGGETVLVDEAADHLHLLNPSGALLWACFDGRASIAELCFDIADELEVPFERVLVDAVDLVGGLLAVGIVSDGRADDVRDTAPADVPPRPRLLDEPPSG